MRSTIWCGWFAVLVVLVALVGCGESPEQKQARAAFDAYVAALKNGDGQEAVKHIGEPTFKHYQTILDHCMDASEAQTRALPLIDRLQVVMIRRHIEPEQIRKMDGREMLVTSIERGWTGDEGMEQLSSGNVAIEFEIEGDTAWGNLYNPKGKDRFDRMFRLDRTDGDWKLDLVHVSNAIMPELNNLLSQNGLSEDEFILMALDEVPDRVVTPDYWEPVGRQ